MDLNQYTDQFDKVLEHLKQDLNSLRTNRATPTILENILVEVYGSKMPLIQVASIQAPEPRMLTVEPWDKTIIKGIEKAIQTASLGLSVANEGNFLRIIMSPMTEETRRGLVRVLGDKLEIGRIAVRGVRDRVKEAIQIAEKNKEISEDEKFKLIDKLDEMTRKYNEKIKEIGEKKEGEIKL